uniref:Transmembrane 9 superfamily member n=1 Tax=Macrostomum lignano TaxID=282301 RepID=A0A1I8FF65_9PLAT
MAPILELGLSSSCPASWRPTLMTLSGFLCPGAELPAAGLLRPGPCAPHQPTSRVTRAVPRAMWLVSALLNFASHTLRRMDGKQARRTGTSSPVGEMFDHGLDSWATLFFPMCVYSVFGRGVYGGTKVRPGELLVSVYAFTFAVGDSFWQTFAFGTWTYPLIWSSSAATMSSTKCQAFNLLTAIYSAVSLPVFLLRPDVPAGAGGADRLLAVCVLLACALTAANVVNQMLDHFKLRAFVIESPQKKSNRSTSLLLLCWRRGGCSARPAAAELYKPRAAPVQVYVNKVGPYFNPHETTTNYQLPRVPAGHHCAQVNEAYGELLDRRTAWRSPCSTSGSARTPPTRCWCSKQLSAADLEQLRTAVEDLYYFEFVVDDIPETGFVPHSHKVFLWTQTSRSGSTSAASASSFVKVVSRRRKAPVDLAKLQPGSQVAFTYSVAWVKSDVKFEDRAKLNQGHILLPPKTLEIHWLSVINSLILVLLLIGFVTVILFRILKKDFASTSASSSATIGGGRAVPGHHHWPVRHGAARPCSTCTTPRQHINSAGIVLYAFTSGNRRLRVLSECSRRLGRERWAANVLLTLLPVRLPAVHGGWRRGELGGPGPTAPPRRCPGPPVLLLLCLWAVPRASRSPSWAGNGRKNAPPGLDAPCRTKKHPQGDPRRALLTRPGRVHCLIGGFPQLQRR